MNPQDELTALLHEHSFDLARQRKHKIYRNPDGLTFVLACTPSDRRASWNALSTLKRMLRQSNRAPEEMKAATPPTSAKDVSEIPAESLPPEPSPTVEPIQPALSDQEWEAWKRQYWHDEKLRKKNETFLSLVGLCVERASKFIREHEGIDLDVVTDSVKKRLRDKQYKSKVLLYSCKGFEKGIVVVDFPRAPVLWASNGHIGVSAFLPVNTYVQHGPSKAASLRFIWEGLPVLLELPEREHRKFLSLAPGQHPRRARPMVRCPVCQRSQLLPTIESISENQGWRCDHCKTINTAEIRCPFCKTGVIEATEFGFGYCPNCSGNSMGDQTAAPEKN